MNINNNNFYNKAKKYNSYSYFLILLLNIINTYFVQAGHIYGWDIELNYNNAGYASEFIFPFSLENMITKNDYLKIIMPFPLHTSYDPVTFVPDNLVATYSLAIGDHHCG